MLLSGRKYYREVEKGCWKQEILSGTRKGLLLGSKSSAAAAALLQKE